MKQTGLYQRGGGWSDWIKKVKRLTRQHIYSYADTDNNLVKAKGRGEGRWRIVKGGGRGCNVNIKFFLN